MIDPNGYWPAGDLLREWCAKHDYTQQMLGDAIGVTNQHISRIMLGKTTFTPEVAVRLERVTGISARKLFRLQGDELIERAVMAAEDWERFETVMKKALNTPPIKRPRKKT